MMPSWSEGKLSDEKPKILLSTRNSCLSQNVSDEFSIPTWFSYTAKWFSENKIPHDVYLR